MINESYRYTKLTIFAIAWVFLSMIGMSQCSGQISDRFAFEIIDSPEFDKYKLIRNDQDKGITIYKDVKRDINIIVKWDGAEIHSRGYVYPYDRYDPWSMIDKMNDHMRKAKSDPRTWTYSDNDKLYKFQMVFGEDTFMILIQSMDL